MDVLLAIAFTPIDRLAFVRTALLHARFSSLQARRPRARECGRLQLRRPAVVRNGASLVAFGFTQNLNRQPLKVLFVGGDHDVSEAASNF